MASAVYPESWQHKWVGSVTSHRRWKVKAQCVFGCKMTMVAFAVLDIVLLMHWRHVMSGWHNAMLLLRNVKKTWCTSDFRAAIGALAMTEIAHSCCRVGDSDSLYARLEEGTTMSFLQSEKVL